MTQQRRSRAARNGIFAIAVAGALVLAGCSGSTGNSDDTKDTQQFSLAFPVSNKVETGYEKLAKKYMDANPDVKITINDLPGESYDQAIRTQLQAGNASDVLVSAPGVGQAYSLVTLAKAGLLAPLDDTAKKLIPAGADSQFVVDGKTYGQALDISFVGNIFNEMPGVAYPTDLAGMLSACSDLKTQGKSLFVIAGSVPANTGIMAVTIAATRVYANDPDWNDKRIAGDVTFADSAGWKDTLDTIVQLNKAGCFQKGAEGAGFDAITNGLTRGDALSMFGPSGAATEINTAAGGHAKFAVQAFPPASSSDAAYGIASSTFSYSISANSKNKVAAQKFLDWMAQPEQSKAFADAQGTLPAAGYGDLDLADSVYAPVEKVLKGGAFTPMPNTSWPQAAVYDALGSGVQGLLTGQKTVDQVLASMDAAWGN
nr:extracellular solute-binding protein [Microbacterium bovistercoris]